MFLKWWPHANRSLVLVVLAAAACVLGAYGSWGALSAVPAQARIVAGTRHLLAGLSLAVLVLAAVPRNRRTFASLSALLFVVVGVIGYGELGYEENQRFAYGATASAWGLVVLMIAAPLGVAASLAEIFQRVRGHRDVGPPSPLDGWKPPG